MCISSSIFTNDPLIKGGNWDVISWQDRLYEKMSLKSQSEVENVYKPSNFPIFLMLLSMLAQQKNYLSDHSQIMSSTKIERVCFKNYENCLQSGRGMRQMLTIPDQGGGGSEKFWQSLKRRAEGWGLHMEKVQHMCQPNAATAEKGGSGGQLIAENHWKMWEVGPKIFTQCHCYIKEKKRVEGILYIIYWIQRKSWWHCVALITRSPSWVVSAGPFPHPYPFPLPRVKRYLSSKHELLDPHGWERYVWIKLT